MTTPIKKYIGDSFVGNTYHFKVNCDCLVPLDVIGKVIDYEIAGAEVLLIVNTDDKTIHIGLNTPGLEVAKIV